MSNDLISRKELMEEVEKSMSFNPHENPTIARNHINEHIHFFRMVQEAPTAYDVDAVCEEIEKLADESREYRNKYNDEQAFGEVEAYCEAIKIVRNGGKRE